MLLSVENLYGDAEVISGLLWCKQAGVLACIGKDKYLLERGSREFRAPSMLRREKNSSGPLQFRFLLTGKG